MSLPDSLRLLELKLRADPDPALRKRLLRQPLDLSAVTAVQASYAEGHTFRRLLPS